jgi:hypothetical protein
MGLEKMTLLITIKTKATIINMNKDEKLLAEAYENVTFNQRKKPFLEKPDRLNPTVNLDEIADFMNKHKIWSGAPVKGAGGWYVHNSEVVNDDAEGGYTGISVRVVPEKKGLVVIEKLRSGGNTRTLISWPVSAKQLETVMQNKTARF